MCNRLHKRSFIAIGIVLSVAVACIGASILFDTAASDSIRADVAICRGTAERDSSNGHGPEEESRAVTLFPHDTEVHYWAEGVRANLSGPVDAGSFEELGLDSRELFISDVSGTGGGADVWEFEIVDEALEADLPSIPEPMTLLFLISMAAPSVVKGMQSTG